MPVVPSAPSSAAPERRQSRRWTHRLAALAVVIGLAVPSALVAGRLAAAAPTVPAPAVDPATVDSATVDPVTEIPTDQPVPAIDGSSTAGQVSFRPAGVPFLTGTPKGNTACNTTQRTPGPAPTGGTFGRAKLADAQVQTGATIISVGKAAKIDRRGIRIALLAAMNESSLDPFAKDGDLLGLFQQPKKGYLRYDRADAIGATRMFYSVLLAKAPKYATDARPDWALAELVQQHGQRLKYNGWRTTSAALVKKLLAKTPAYDFHPSADSCPQDGEAKTGVPQTFDPGFIISDEVFYNAKAMTLKQIRAFIESQGRSCTGDQCLKNIRLRIPTIPANEFCLKIPGGTDDAAEVIWKVSVACHINPQVMLVTLQKESGLLTDSEVAKSDYDAAWGWHCPDTGPGGSARCDPEHAGFFNQAAGMAKQWSRYVVNPDEYHYHAGQQTTILYNVEESGCGGAAVTIRNKATASLYNYTPYQPNSAALASYPGVGDACSTYGNRNFYFLFARYFGTLGEKSVEVNGAGVTIPDNAFVPEGLAGRTITAPTPQMAKGVAAGLAVLGTPYVWGGGTADGPADEGCSRGGGAKNSCQGLVGLDCSGLTGYVLQQAGFRIGTNSSTQRSAGTGVPWKEALPGDIIGYSGHVAIYLGVFDGVPYMLESPDVGKHVHIRDVRGGSDPEVHRYWS